MTDTTDTSTPKPVINLSQIKPSRSIKPPRLLIYGRSGIGKSTFAAQFPGTIFMDIEEGLDNIECSNHVTKSYGDALQLIKALLDQEHNFKTLAIDSADWLENLIFDRALEVYNVDAKVKASDFGSIGYGQGYAIAMDLWGKLLKGLSMLREQKTMTIIMLAHLDTKRHESPISDVDSFDIYTPKLHGKTSKGASSLGLLTEWADICGYADYEIRTKLVDKGFGNKDAKALGNSERMLYTNSDNPAFIAKSRYNIPSPIPFDWNVFNKEIVKSVSKKEGE